MKAVCRALGVARSNLRKKASRAETWCDGRKRSAQAADADLAALIHSLLQELPTYGYRRVCALVNRDRLACGEPRVNPKRIYRVMANSAMLLPRAPRKRQSSRQHKGKVMVGRSNLRWCSDGFEIKCDSGQTVTATFLKDCCDREIMAWRAWEGKGLPAQPVHEMLIDAVELRFGCVEGVPQGYALEFLSDNGSAYIAKETRRIAKALGLQPINTPVCSPQSNGMAESFVNTFRRDYVNTMDLSDAQTVLGQLAAAFEHFNEVHPHSALKMKSPREFRRHQALHCA